jgi:hypothetical protein
MEYTWTAPRVCVAGGYRDAIIYLDFDSSPSQVQTSMYVASGLLLPEDRAPGEVGLQLLNTTS